MLSVQISRRGITAAAAILLAIAGCRFGDPEPFATPDGGGSGGGSGGTRSDGNWKVLNVQYEAQVTSYWCGPAATRIALSAQGNPPSQQSLANQLRTTENGTDWIGQITDVLNTNLGGGAYRTIELPNDPPIHGEKDRFWRDIVDGIDSNHPLVVNIVAPASNHPPGYPNETIYHYFTVIGYNPQTWEVFIADPANFGGNHHYWLTFDQLATLVPPKGYSVSTTGNECRGLTMGAIDDKYRALGGCGSVVGAPITNEQTTLDGVGRFNVFEHGSIYWTPALGAFEVHGLIRDRWKTVGWETGALGYPVSDEVALPDGGRYSVFERGSIYWTPETGAHEVVGVIRDRWASLGWEAGALGYPVSGEYAVAEGRRTDFQHGSITWNATTHETAVVTP